MQGRKIFSILIIAALIITIAISGCIEEEENLIIVGTSADFPPFEYKDENQKIIGFDIDMIKTILEELGYKLEVKDIAFDSLIASLQTDKIDVIVAGMTITEDRENQVDFSEPYYEADQSILIMADSNIIINKTEDMINLTIGAQTGTTGAAWIQENLIDTGLMSEEYLKRYEVYTLAILDLINENLDAIILDKPVALAYKSDQDMEVIYTIITNEYYGIAVKEGETELLEEINKGLQDLKDSDDWNNLVKKYFE